MNSALRQINSILWVWTITRNYFFIVFSFQQNKWYPNVPFIYVFVWVLIEVAFCITFCCSGSCSNYITLKTNCWLCLLQHRKPADDMLIGCSSRSPVGDGPASPKYSDRLSLAVNNYLSEASRQEVKSKLILLLKFWESMFRCFFFFFWVICYCRGSNPRVSGHIRDWVPLRQLGPVACFVYYLPFVIHSLSLIVMLSLHPLNIYLHWSVVSWLFFVQFIYIYDIEHIQCILNTPWNSNAASGTPENGYLWQRVNSQLSFPIASILVFKKLLQTAPPIQTKRPF